MRASAYGTYPLRMAMELAAAQPRLLAVISSNTFYAPWFALKLRLRGIPVIHWVLDLYPEALVAAGKISFNGVAARLLRRMMRDTFQGAAANVFLGEHLLRYAETVIGPVPRSVVIPIGADGAPFRATAPGKRTPSPDAPVKVLYCGNMGHLHEVETVASAVESGIPAGIEMAFCGNGAGFATLSKRVGGGRRDSTIRFGGNLPDDVWEGRMLESDIALVTMSVAAEGIVMPSKAYSAMVAGQAILAICPKNSDLASLIRKHDLGWIVQPGDVVGLIDALRSISNKPEDTLRKRRNAWETGQTHYGQDVISHDWLTLFRQVIHNEVASVPSCEVYAKSISLT